MNPLSNPATKWLTCERPTAFSTVELQQVRSVVFAPDVHAKNRLSYFFKRMHLFSTGAIWYALRLSYEMGEVRPDHLPLLHKMLCQDTPVHAMMEREELRVYSKLPETITVFKVLTSD